ncbi:MAG: hypothetical protein ACMXYF_03475 [Candidatus Woesearchaeota archaeon]
MKTVQDIVRGIEKRLKPNTELELIPDKKAIEIVDGDGCSGFWVNNIYAPLDRTNPKKTYQADLRVLTNSRVQPLEGIARLEEVDIGVYKNGQEVAFEKFDGYNGVELNPVGEIMSRYAIEFLGDRGIDLRKDFEFIAENNPFFFPEVRRDFLKDKDAYQDAGINIDLASRRVEVSYVPESIVQFPAHERLNRILSTYNSLLKEE